MFLKVTNIRFVDDNGQPATKLDVPVDLTDAKLWLDDYNMPYNNDADVLKTYIRTQLFYGAIELLYDVEPLEESNCVSDTTANISFNESMIDHKYAEYREQQFIITMPEQFIIEITEDDVFMFNREENQTEKDLYEQVAFSRMLHELHFDIKLDKPKMKTKRELQNMLLIAFGHKLLEALDYADEQYDMFEDEIDDVGQAEHNVQLLIEKLNAVY